MLQVQPDVEGRLWRDGNLEAEVREALEDMVALVLEVLLQSKLFLVNVFRIQERNSSKLQPGDRCGRSGDVVISL